MRRIVLVLLGVAVGMGAGLALATWSMRPKPRALPDGPSVITQLREVAQLETLELEVYKKLSFAPDPPAPSDSTWSDVLHWAKYNLRDPHGRAILFAKVRLGLDLSKLDAEHVRVEGERVWLVLPPVTTHVELEPGQTEIIDSNLDSAETAQLLDAAKGAFERDAAADPRLRERARQSSERALRALLITLGFRDVSVVEQLPATHGA